MPPLSPSSPPRAAAVVPAAGRSRRMGRPKPLLPWGGTTLVGALIEALAAGGVDRVVVVTAPGDHDLAAEVARHGARTAVNPSPGRGMLSSVVAGIEALGGAGRLAADRTALVVAPADHPAIRPPTVTALLAALDTGRHALVVPTHDGRRGHPLVVAPGLVDEIPRLDPEVGLRQLLARRAGRLRELPVDDPGTLLDVDTPAAYRRLLEVER